MTSTPYDPSAMTPSAPGRERGARRPTAMHFTAYPHPIPRPRRWSDNETGTAPGPDPGAFRPPHPSVAVCRPPASRVRTSHLELIVGR
jgi:hypothetical protein